MTITLEERLCALPMELRQTLYIIWARSDSAGRMLHPDGKSVTFIIGDAIDRHPGTVYRYLNQLEELGFIQVEKHPELLRRGRSNGAAVRLIDKGALAQDHLIMLLVTPPNAKFLQQRIDRLKQENNQTL